MEQKVLWIRAWAGNSVAKVEIILANEAVGLREVVERGWSFR